MTHKATLQAISEMRNVPDISDTELLTLIFHKVNLALESPGRVDSAELKKQLKDRKRAEASIVVMQHILDDPKQNFIKIAADAVKCRRAIVAHLVRMQAAVTDAEALRDIYRRNEKR